AQNAARPPPRLRAFTLSLASAIFRPSAAAGARFTELLTFFDFPQPLWRKLRTTHAIERCFVEVRRRTRPMVLFTNIQSVERILYAIFYRFNQQWQNHTLRLFTQAA